MADPNNDSLITALAGDAATVGTAYFASAAAAKVATSPNAKYLIYGGVAIAALVLIFFVVKKH